MRLPTRLPRFLFALLLACGPVEQVLEPDAPSAIPGHDAGGPGAGDGALAPPSGGYGESDADLTPVSDAAAPLGANADPDAGPPPGPKDADCDLSGIWAGRQVTLSWALGVPQYASTWYYLEFAQSGESVVVTKHFDCGVQVSGTVLVNLTPSTVRSFISHNVQNGRQGSMKKTSGRCEFAMERFWSVRGADVAKFLPRGADARLDIAAIAARNPLPTKDEPAGAEDWENDGQLGAAWQVSGIVQGTRNTVQRDWTEWFTDAGHTITPRRDWGQNLVVRVRFANEENVLHASNPTISVGGAADASAEHTFTLRFFGRSTSDARAQAILQNDAFDTCLAIQTALPAAEGL